MMAAVVIRKSHGSKVVMVTGHTTSDDDEAVLQVALDKASETKPDLFGWALDRRPDRVLVTLHTD